MKGIASFQLSVKEAILTLSVLRLLAQIPSHRCTRLTKVIPLHVNINFKQNQENIILCMTVLLLLLVPS